MSFAFFGHGGQGTSIVKKLIEANMIEVIEIETVETQYKKEIEKILRASIYKKLSDSDLFDHSKFTMTSAAIDIETKPISIPEEYHAVMSYYGHIRDKPERVGVITCLV